MSESTDGTLPGAANGIPLDAAELDAAKAAARAAGASVAAAADRLMTLDEAPWSFDTLRALAAADASK